MSDTTSFDPAIVAITRRAESAEARAERYRKALEKLVEAWGESDDDTDAPSFIAAMDAARAALRGEG